VVFDFYVFLLEEVLLCGGREAVIRALRIAFNNINIASKISNSYRDFNERRWNWARQ
jgi:hypothetical protein